MNETSPEPGGATPSRTHVFVGPTLTSREAHQTWPDAVYHPPACQGDIYRVVAREAPAAIGIIDGYFTHVPSVWHKEILHALAAGIPVCGSASMGALRAAELAQFGMVGIGVVFEAYQEGVLHPFEHEPFEDDDEVAVLHGPAEVGYLALSEALVNIRLTLALASAEGVIPASTRDHLVAAGKRLFYQERSYQALLESGRGRVAGDELERLERWLPDRKVDQKRLDARAMLDALANGIPSPPNLGYTVSETTYWERAKALIDSEVDGTVSDLR